MIRIQETPVFVRWAPFVARILFAIIFLFSAVGKIPGTDSFAMEVAMSGDVGLPFPTLMVTLAFILEIITAIMLITGWYTRLAALLLAGFTLLIGITFVHDLTDQMQMMIFFSCMQLIAGLLYIATYGAKSMAVRPD